MTMDRETEDRLWREAARMNGEPRCTCGHPEDTGEMHHSPDCEWEFYHERVRDDFKDLCYQWECEQEEVNGR